MRHEDFLVAASPSLQRRGHEKYACHSLLFLFLDTLLYPHADFDEEVDKMLLKRVPGSEERLKGEVVVVVSPFSLIKRREIETEKDPKLQNERVETEKSTPFKFCLEENSCRPEADGGCRSY